MPNITDSDSEETNHDTISIIEQGWLNLTQYGISESEDSSVNGGGGNETPPLLHNTGRECVHPEQVRFRPTRPYIDCIDMRNSVTVSSIFERLYPASVGTTARGLERVSREGIKGDITILHVIDTEHAAIKLMEPAYLQPTVKNYTFDDSKHRWTVKKTPVNISRGTWNKNSDPDQIVLNVFLAHVEETRLFNSAVTQSRLEISDRILSCLKRGILPHYLFEEFNILGKESKGTLLSIQQDVGKFQQYVMNDVSETTLLAHTINQTGKNRRLTEAEVIAQIAELSDRAFNSYDKSCKDPHYPRLKLVNELNFLRTKDSSFHDIELMDKNSRHLGEAKEGFLKVVDIGRSYRRTINTQLCTLAQLCITSLFDSRPLNCSDAIELSRQCAQQRKNGVDFIQTEKPMNAAPVKKIETAEVKENLIVDSLGECLLALIGIYRTECNLETMKHHIKQLCIILPEMVVSKVEIAVILLEEGKCYLAEGRVHQAKANFEQARVQDPENLDVLLYLCLLDRENAYSYLRNWLEKEVEDSRQKFYLYFFSEFDLELLEDFQELYTEVRFLMAFEDANVKFLKNEPDRGISTISRVHFPARSVLSLIASQILRNAKRLDAKSHAKLLGIAKYTASRCSGNAKYQAWSLFGHLQKGVKARESYKKARAAFGDKCSYLILQREWEFSKDDIKGTGCD